MKKWGMWKGPFTHAALAVEAITVGFGPDTALQEFARGMKNVESTVVLIANRLYNDFASSPTGLRRSSGPADVVALQKVCRLFELACDIFRAKVADKTYKK